MIIGVGNPYRRDDGVGLAVLTAVGRGVESSGDAADLLALMAGAERVVLVDAMSAGSPPGTVHVLHCRDGSWDRPPPPNASTHGLGVADAVALGKALGVLPPQLHLIGVEVADRGYGEGLSPDVAAAVPRAADLVRALTSPSPADSAARPPPL